MIWSSREMGEGGGGSSSWLRIEELGGAAEFDVRKASHTSHPKIVSFSVESS